MGKYRKESYDYEIKQGGWKEELIPFYSIGNGHYSHEETDIDKEANSFEEWLNQVPAFLS